MALLWLPGRLQNDFQRSRHPPPRTRAGIRASCCLSVRPDEEVMQWMVHLAWLVGANEIRVTGLSITRITGSSLTWQLGQLA